MSLAPWIFIAVAVAASPVAAPQAPATMNTLPPCSDPSITTPPQLQTQISLADSYPPLSVVLGEQGDTKLLFTVKSNGTADNVRVTSGSGSLRLDDAAVGAVRQLLYSPPKAGDVAVSCTKYMMIKWRFSDQNPAPTANAASAMLLTPPRALYPPAALAKHEEGFTEVLLFLGRDGKIINAHVGRSSNGDDLNAASLAYVRTLDLKPGSISGNAAPTVLNVTVIWMLDPPAGQPARN
jgi:TonB family protein